MATEPVNLVEPDEPDPSQDAVTAEPRELWEQKVDESQRAYSAFSAYRDSEKRSFKNVAAALNPPCSVQNVWQWSVRHCWKLRADAFDLHQDREQRQQFARNRVRMRDRHLAVARGMLDVAANALVEWQRKIAQKMPLDLSPETISMLTKCATELEKSTLGVATESGRTQINILVGSHLYCDEDGGAGSVAAVAESWEPLESFESRQYERLTDEEKAAWRSWKNPPEKKPDAGFLNEAEFDSDDDKPN
jgi:hypothetical protein